MGTRSNYIFILLTSRALLDVNVNMIYIAKSIYRNFVGTADCVSEHLLTDFFSSPTTWGMSGEHT